jgi:pimeloyl-ACP methyl ester carboxylesterase
VSALPEPPVQLRHGRIELALHQLRTSDADQRPLLLLHGLGERTPRQVPVDADAWPGSVWGLDFTGHGESTVPVGGGYTCESLMADADAAIAHLGQVTLLGRGLGAYVALMLAGARAEDVHGAVLTDGHGLAGGGPAPGTPTIDAVEPRAGVPDPYALLELSTDVRPPSYATSYVRLATQGSGLDDPIVVSARYRPPWLEAVADEPGVLELPVAEGLARYG